MFRRLVTKLAFVAVCVFTHTAEANLVVNGSFEADSFAGPPGPGYRLGLVGNDVTGWFIPSSDGIYPWGLQNSNAFSAGPTPYGNQWLVLGRYDTHVNYTIQQTITGLTPGATYRLSFAIASESGCCSTVEVSFLDGSSTAAQDFTAPTSGNYWKVWGTETMDFVATSSSVTLQFKDLNPTTNGYDVGLDNVDVESLCGDGVVDGNEQCDDGLLNGTTQSCCSATCQFIDPIAEILANPANVATDLQGVQCLLMELEKGQVPSVP